MSFTNEPSFGLRPAPRSGIPAAHRPLAYLLAMVGVLYFYSGFGTFTALGPVSPGQVTYVLVGGGLFVGVVATLSGQALRNLPIGLIVVAALYIVLIAANASINGADPIMLRDRAAYALALIASLLVFAAVRRFDHVVTALQIVVAIACVLNAIDYFVPHLLPVKMSPVAGRGGGLYINPNAAAAHIALAIPIICAMPRRRMVLALYAMTFLGVAFTLSRSGMLMWLAAVAMTELFVRNRTHAGTRLVGLGLAVAFALALLILAGNAIAEAIVDVLGPSLPPGLRDRVFLNIHDYAADQRRYGAVAAWRLFTNNPWTGAGLGFGGQWQFNEFSHNMVLQTLAELGVLGGVWLLAFVTALWRIRGPFAISLTALWLIGSMFSHNMFDYVGLAVIIAVYWCAAMRTRALYHTG